MPANSPHALEAQLTVEQGLLAAQNIIYSSTTAASSVKLNDIRKGLVKRAEPCSITQEDSEKQNGSEKLDLRGTPTSEELLRWLAKSIRDKS
jgi:hypothetical protein